MLRAARPDAPPPSLLARLVSSTRVARIAAALGQGMRRRLPMRPRTALLVLALVAVAAAALPRLLGGSWPLPTPRVGRVLPAPERQAADARRPATMPGEESAAQSVAAPMAPPGDSPGMSWGRRILRRATVEVELPDVDRGISRLIEVLRPGPSIVGGPAAGPPRSRR